MRHTRGSRLRGYQIVYRTVVRSTLSSRLPALGRTVLGNGFPQLLNGLSVFVHPLTDRHSPIDGVPQPEHAQQMLFWHLVLSEISFSVMNPFTSGSSLH